MSQDLKWSKHISYITSKANQRIGALYRQSPKMTRTQIETMYLSTIRPILEYGSVLFTGCTVGDAKLIENVQRRAAVLSTGAIRRTESLKLMAETGWDSLEIRRKRSCMLLFFQIVKGTTSFYLTNRISFKSQVQERSSRSTSRHNMLVTEPRCRLNCYKTSFFPQCIRYWNSFNSTVVNCTSTCMFKNRLLTLPAYASSDVRSMDTIEYNKVLKGHNGKLVTQFRLGLSPLRNELFTYNIIENPFCPSGCDKIENFNHYIFECDSYIVPRAVLFANITALCVDLNQSFNFVFDLTSPTAVAHLLTHGINLPQIDCTTRVNINSAIFNMFSNYISQTSRFVIAL